ncbi:DUF721 domain-containing protein [Monaibacterium marinum]|uniref:DUF721 domain-containing protein n=1 Tax=Pontivivens marinum TaxID=1690039 RepID=UPI000BF1122D|nr:DciA family protein [Monaibacterium marinum]
MFSLPFSGAIVSVVTGDTDVRKPGKPPQPRRKWKFTQAGSLIAPQLRKASEKRGFAQTRLLTDWDDVVGPEIAALARPVKVGYTKNGMGATLTVLVSGAAAPQVQMMAPTIRDRVNACYGYAAISRVSLTQTAPGGLAVPQAGATAAAKPELSPERVEALRSDLREVADDGLRAALMSLGKNIESKTL